MIILFFFLEMQSLQPFHDSKSYNGDHMYQHIERIRTRFEAYQNLSPSSLSWFLTAKHYSVCQRPHSSEHSKQNVCATWYSSGDGDGDWCLIILADAASSHCLISVCFPPNSYHQFYGEVGTSDDLAPWVRHADLHKRIIHAELFPKHSSCISTTHQQTLCYWVRVQVTWRFMSKVIWKDKHYPCRESQLFFFKDESVKAKAISSNIL